ncbi:hypothetical protein LCGC14_3092430 [marine sediment metagenome]|uniref:Uncharacterized protein n=1 Tax=marine sediment metagenome TaxID=412755 RepID=A0A0F8WAL4_9ZZZZ
MTMKELGERLVDGLLLLTIKVTSALLLLIKPRTIFTLGFFGATIYLLIINKPITELLKTIDIALLAFYFGEKSAKYLQNGRNGK